MTSADFDWAPPATHALIASAIATTQADPRIVGLTLGGSAATGTMDEFSDLDFVVVCRDEDQQELLHNAPSIAAKIGPLLASFTGEHVGEPRLLICLYGPPARHVDLKFVAERDLDDRVEDGRILWQRDGALDAAHRRKPAVWPSANPQWIEDRFWIWIHYGATKIGRGELFECLDVLAFLRGVVLGPLIAERRGYRANGMRRIETTAPDLVPALEATVGDHTRQGCIDAIHAAVDLYQALRDDAGIERRARAESASLTYLAEIEGRHADERAG
jgi:predicted nucleotidyltransferase